MGYPMWRFFMQQIIILIISVSDKKYITGGIIMGSIGSINKPSKGFLVAAIQMPVPIINSRADIDKQVKEIVRTLHATKAGYPGAEHFKMADGRIFV